jgi:hypothetical protein
MLRMTKLRWSNPPGESDPARVQRDESPIVLSDSKSARLRNIVQKNRKKKKKTGLTPNVPTVIRTQNLTRQCLKAKQRCERAANALRAAQRNLKNAEVGLAKAEIEHAKLVKLWRESNPSA